MNKYYVEIYFLKFDGGKNLIFVGHGLNEEALLIILDKYNGMNFRILIDAEVRENGNNDQRNAD